MRMSAAKAKQTLLAPSLNISIARWLICDSASRKEDMYNLYFAMCLLLKMNIFQICIKISHISRFFNYNIFTIALPSVNNGIWKSCGLVHIAEKTKNKNTKNE
jgi:hypothetical protein